MKITFAALFLVMCLGSCGSSSSPTPSPTPKPLTSPKTMGDGWVEYQSSEGIFSLKFPKKPEENPIDIDTPAGKMKFNMASYTNNQDVVLNAGCVPLPLTEGQTYDIKKGLDGARDQSLTNMNARAVSEKEFSSNGVPGRDITFTADHDSQKLAGRALYFTRVGAKLVDICVVLAINAGSSPSPETDFFINSVTIKGK